MLGFQSVAQKAVSEAGSLDVTQAPIPAGLGAVGFLGLGKESTWGTAVLAAYNQDGDFHALLSENLTLTKDRYDVKNIHGKYSEPDDVVGMDRVVGEIVAPAYPQITGRFLRGVFNTVSGEVVQSGALWTTRFISTKSLFSTGVPSQPYTMEVFRGVNSSQLYYGCVVNRLQMSVTPNQPIRLSAQIVGKGMQHIARSLPTFSNSPTEPFTFDACSVSVGGSATARMEAFAVSIDNGLDGVAALNASREIARMGRRAFQLVRVTGTYDFADIAEYEDFRNQTERQMVMSLFKANSFQLVVDMPRVVYTAFPLGMPGQGRLTINFEGSARFHTGSDLAIDCRLTTTNSTF